MLERIIIFGATGDLTSRLLMPAIAHVAEEGLLPENLTIVGSARNKWTTDQFRAHIKEKLETHAPDRSPLCRDNVVGRITYCPSDVTSGEDVSRIIGAARQPTLVYLALPSGLIEKALLALSEANLDENDAIAIEKPFGVDQASAKKLNALINKHLHRPKLFRVDHFLSSELIRRILSLRFMNRIFEPSLNCNEVERVEINWMEKLALEGRAGYYDKAGAMKDMIQNHLLEALSLVIMNQPARLDEASFRAMRVEALRSIKTPSKEDIIQGTTRGRYTAGKMGDRDIPNYVDEPGVDPARQTETYASVQLHVHTPRWEDTKFILRSGKGMPENRAEMSIHFRSVPSYLGDSCERIQPNVLRIGLKEPYVKLDTVVNGKDLSSVGSQLEMVSSPPTRKPYANLILEMLNNRATLFIRGDEVEEAWRIVDPIAEAWKSNLVPLDEYPAGTQPD